MFTATKARPQSVSDFPEVIKLRHQLARLEQQAAEADQEIRNAVAGTATVGLRERVGAILAGGDPAPSRQLRHDARAHREALGIAIIETKGELSSEEVRANAQLREWHRGEYQRLHAHANALRAESRAADNALAFFVYEWQQRGVDPARW